jgi:hypothetical protein
MTVLAEAGAPYLKPLPQVAEANREFFEGLKRREFLVPKCDQCGDYNWVPYPACRSCLSEDQTWTRVSGEATVYTYSVIYRGPGLRRGRPVCRRPRRAGRTSAAVPGACQPGRNGPGRDTGGDADPDRLPGHPR